MAKAPEVKVRVVVRCACGKVHLMNSRTFTTQAAQAAWLRAWVGFARNMKHTCPCGKVTTYSGPPDPDLPQELDGDTWVIQAPTVTA